jgi:hypothetical protein
MERAMAKMAFVLSAAALAGALLWAGLPPANADSAATSPSRPRIVIHPRHVEPGPNAKRYCRSWLAKEYRVSGPVIVPRMQCWWQ